MNQTPKTLLLGALAALALSACQKGGDASPEGAASPPVAQQGADKAGADKAGADTAAADKAPADKAPADKAAQAAPAEKNYQVRVVRGEAAVGQPHTSVVEVTPAPGYKMNLEFPSKLRLSEQAKIAAPKQEFSGEDLSLTEEALKFTIPYTAKEAGEIDLSAHCDFSVCNENACKLVRGEEVAWTVTAKATAPN